MNQEQNGYVTKFFTSQDVKFIQACANVLPPYGKVSGNNQSPGIPPTHRQASKWLRGKGIAYKTMIGRI